MERGCRMKRIVMGVVTLAMACSMAIGQASLMNEATNGLFKDVNDFVIKPNAMFNTVKSKQLIIGGGFENLSFQTNATGGGLLGYYHPGKMPWSVAVSLDMRSDVHAVSSTTVNNKGETISETTYKNPAFNTYKGGARFTLGMPSVMNLSAGVVAHFEGTSANNAKTTTTNAQGQEAVEILGQIKTMDMIIGIPIGFTPAPTVYNFVEPMFFFSQNTTIVGGYEKTNAANQQLNPQAGAVKNESEFRWHIYDKVTIYNMFIVPFDSETSLWVGAGNAGLSLIDELEKPAYTIKGSDFEKDARFFTQFGLSHMMDFALGEVKLRIKPMTYFDLLLHEHKSSVFGATIAASAGIYAPLANLPLALFFGMTPGLQFYNTKFFVKEGAETITTTEKSQRALATNVFWTGKIGTSIMLPKDSALDITLNVNPSGKHLSLSALMSISL